MKIRSFLAFDISDSVRDRLSRVIADFSEKERRIKWIKPGNMHITMKFFRSVEEDMLLGDIAVAIENITRVLTPAMLKCQGVGVFPNWKYPRVIWAGFVGETEKIVDMQKRIEMALAPIALHEDKRDFRLHLTLGRARGALKKSPLMDLVEKLGPVPFGDLMVDRLILYKSVLTKNGPIYTPLKEFKLLGK